MTDGTVIVTGGSGEIGSAICARSAEDGYDVVNLDLVPPAPDVPGRWARLDLTDARATREVLAREAGAAPVLRLVHCAGVVRPATLDATSAEDFDAVISLNLRSAVLCAQAVVPGMRRAGFGRIVSISSRASLGKQLRTAYSASKAALHGMTRTWALELAKDGVTVNAVAPGSIETRLFREANPPEDPRTAAIIAAIPVGRIGTPADIAQAVSFFLDRRSGFVTGQVMYVCGGLTVGLSQ
jgi:NAD(P)-dependent dehydrogenase (short-subunit alcohol dehydrogenase family)